MDENKDLNNNVEGVGTPQPAVSNDNVVNGVQEPIAETGVPEVAEVSTPSVTSETVISTDVNQVMPETETNATVDASSAIQEVSVNADVDAFNNLKESEISESSVFNKKDDGEAVGTGMKEGQVYDNHKRGTPIFMIIMLVLVIIVAFFVNDIVAFVDNFFNKPPEEISSPKDEQDKTVDLTSISKAMSESDLLFSFAQKHNIKVDVQVEENHLLLTTTNYLNPVADQKSLQAQYDLQNGILSTSCDINNTSFCRDMSIILVEEVAALNGVTSEKLDKFVQDNLYTMTIDKGFAFSNSEDGNNTYLIATNVKLNVAD